ncbi:MAG: hypothetical protein AAF436_09690, partial [Myxococcota bacterium]
MRHQRLSLFFCLFELATVTFASRSAADTATPSAVELLAGSYRYVGNWERDEAEIQASVDKAIANLSWLGRRIADNRLASHRERPTGVVIARAGENLSITMGEYKAVAPLDGQPRDVVAPNNRDSKLSYRFSDDTITQSFSAEHAKRKSTYSLDDRGRLVMTVYMTSEKLAAPIAYEL